MLIHTINRPLPLRHLLANFAVKSFPASPFTQLTAGKQEMIVARQHPLLWWCIRRSAKSQHVGSALKTRVTCVSDPS